MLVYEWRVEAIVSDKKDMGIDYYGHERQKEKAY